MRSLLLVASLIAVAFAGCTDTPEEPAPEAMTTETMEGEAPAPTFGPHSGLLLERPGDWFPRLDTPPLWVLGEWWDVHATSGFDGTEYDIKRIVAGKEGTDYLVGMPIETFDDEIMVLHHPGMGLVKSSTLGYETHDHLFELVQFPLEVGASWDSLWQSATNTVTHTVESVDEDAMTAEIVMTGGQSATYTYDANLGVISQFDAPGYMSWEVTAHGFDHEGTVRVPHGHDMHIFHGRLGPVTPVQLSSGVTSDAGVCLPGAVGPCTDVAAPIETFTIPEGYDRASFSVILLDLPAFVAGTPALGAYDVTGTAPDGTEFGGQLLPGGPAVFIESYGYDQPGGEWNLQTIAAGAGQAFIEGVVYVTFDVVLPEGCVIVTENVHDHGGECGGHVHDIE